MTSTLFGLGPEGHWVMTWSELSNSVHMAAFMFLFGDLRSHDLNDQLLGAIAITLSAGIVYYIKMS